MPHQSRTKKHQPRSNGGSKPEVLDVEGMAALLTVSVDTVYDLLKSGQLPGAPIRRGARQGGVGRRLREK